MLPIANRLLGLSSFLGVIYFASHYNKTNVPGLVKMFNGGTIPVKVNVDPWPVEIDGDRTTGDSLLVEDRVEERPFVTPLEITIIDDTNVKDLEHSNWLILGYYNQNNLC